MNGYTWRVLNEEIGVDIYYAKNNDKIILKKVSVKKDTNPPFETIQNIVRSHTNIAFTIGPFKDCVEGHRAAYKEADVTSQWTKK